MEALDALAVWYEEIGRITERYFPKSMYGDASESDVGWEVQHPAHLFVGSCVFSAPDAVVDHLEVLIRPQPVLPSRLAYEPSDYTTMRYHELTKEVLFWQMFARTFLSHVYGGDVVEHLIERAGWFGRMSGRLELPHHLMHAPLENSWWYLPLTPATTAKDIEDAAPVVAAMLRDIFGADRLDQTIRELQAEGMSHREIAEALGVAERTVRRALDKSPD